MRAKPYIVESYAPSSSCAHYSINSKLTSQSLCPPIFVSSPPAHVPTTVVSTLDNPLCPPLPAPLSHFFVIYLNTVGDNSATTWKRYICKRRRSSTMRGWIRPFSCERSWKLDPARFGDHAVFSFTTAGFLVDDTLVLFFQSFFGRSQLSFFSTRQRRYSREIPIKICFFFLAAVMAIFRKCNFSFFAGSYDTVRSTVVGVALLNFSTVPLTAQESFTQDSAPSFGNQIICGWVWFLLWKCWNSNLWRACCKASRLWMA